MPAKGLPDVADLVLGKLGELGVVVLAARGEEKVDLVAGASPGAVQLGVRAGELVGIAAAEVGGGGGGKDTMARAGGREPDSTPAALSAVRVRLEDLLG